MNGEDPCKPPPPWVQAVTIGWASFLAASVATLLFFATFDPQTLAGVATFPTHLSPLAGYTLGFFFFWALGAGTAALAVFLLQAYQRRRSQT
jgi:hypothetical protein